MTKSTSDHHHDCPDCKITWSCDKEVCVQSGAGYCENCFSAHQPSLRAEIRSEVKAILEKLRPDHD